MRSSLKSSATSASNAWDEDIQVPEFLQKGVEFQLCQDTFVSGLQPVQKCLIKVDELGFFLHWKSQEQEGQVLDCSQIKEVCNHGYQTKDQKAYAQLEAIAKNGPGPASDRIIILVCGVDLVNYSTFLLLAEDAETAQKWSNGIRTLIHNPLRHNICLMTALRKNWMKLTFSANRNGQIQVKSIARPFSSGKNTKIALQGLKDLGFPHAKTDVIDLKEFTFEKFFHLYQIVCPRNDIESIFNSLTGGAKCKYVEVGPLAQWLNDHQRDPRLNEILFPMYDHKRAKQLIENHEPDPDYAKKGRFTLEGFSRYMTSLENSPIYRERLVVFEDMEQPLCHYFVNSSHNTYLNGRQFGGKSSAEIYRQVLLTGCRCIELDCWDGKGDQTEPIITHGKAMCSDVLFKDVIIAIKETAFITSEYPLILSFENHCSKPQQLKMAKYCEEIFGDYLLGKPLDDCPLDRDRPLPSPNMLKRKIIIKNKRLKPDDEKVQLERYYKHEEIPEEEDDEENQDSLSIEEAHPELSRLKSDPSRVDLDDGQTDVPVHKPISKSDSVKTNGSGPKEEGLKKIESVSEMSVKGGKSKMKKIEQLTEEDEKELLRNYKYVETSSTNIHPVLSSLINYCQSVKFQGFEHAEEQKVSYHMSSFSESTGIGLLKTSAIEFVNYNKRQLSRIYPRGNRVDSSNYMPQVFWNAGCQLVSLNFQTSDLSMQLNQGKFEHNGMCGYLLKPEFMRRDDRMFDPFSESPVDGVIAAHCSVQVISGLFLSDKQIGTYVEVDMYGLPTDTIRKEHRTRLVPSNGLNPVYNSEQFVFRKVILPNLALMRFAVHDENGKLLGQRVIPLDALQCGYRHISLRSASGQTLAPASLFCNIVLKSYVPDGLSDFVNALADPKKYLSIAEARATQMRNMGIDEDDLAENGKANGARNGKDSVKQRQSGSESDKKSSSSFHTPESESGLTSWSSQPAAGTGDEKTRKSTVTTHRQYLPSSNHMVQQNPVKDLMRRTPVTVAMLMEDPAYIKLVMAQTKELQRLLNKRLKEQNLMERKHQEKLNSFIRKMEQGDSVAPSSLCCFAPKIRANVYTVNGDFKTRLNSLHQDDRQKALALQQTHKDTESTLTQTYDGTLTSMNSRHKQQLIDGLQRALTFVHQDGIIKLKEAQEKEMSGLTQHQTKSSMMSTRGITLDKSIKRAEKDRRIREMSSSNAKKFMEERQMVGTRHTRELEKVKREQEDEVETLTDAINREVEKVIQKRMEEWEKRRELGEHSPLEKTDSDNVFQESQCPVIAE